MSIRLARLALGCAFLFFPTPATAQCCHKAEKTCTAPEAGCVAIPTSLLNEMLDGSKSAQLLKKSRSHPEALYIPAQGTREAAKLDVKKLEQVRDFYRTLSTVHLEAAVSFNFPDRVGTGTFEYWAKGAKYRLRATVDPRLGLASGLEAAYDGVRYQNLYLDDARLSLQRENPGQIPTPFSNPFFLPVSFLSSAEEACGACELTLSDLSDEKRWLSRVGEARGIREKSSDGALLLPGGRSEGKLFFFRVVFAQGNGLISKIESVRPDGVVFRSLELTGYEKFAKLSQPFPSHMVVSALSESGKPMASIHFMVKTLELNVPIESKRFTIPLSSAETVIDEDGPTFLKHPQMEAQEKPPREH
jgi:hypothetical protein